MNLLQVAILGLLCLITLCRASEESEFSESIYYYAYRADNETNSYNRQLRKSCATTKPYTFAEFVTRFTSPKTQIAQS